MTIEEFKTKLDALLKGFPASGFDTVVASEIAELDNFYKEAGKLEMQSGKKLISNLIEALKTRRAGGNADESVQVRLTALEFYVQNLQNGSTEDL